MSDLPERLREILTDQSTDQTDILLQSIASHLKDSEDHKTAILLLATKVIAQTETIRQHETRLKDFETLYQKYKGGVMLLLILGSFIGWASAWWDKLERFIH